jgi:hypothetical protein
VTLSSREEIKICEETSNISFQVCKEIEIKEFMQLLTEPSKETLL